MIVGFTAEAWGQYKSWKRDDAQTEAKIDTLIEECRRHPFRGTGKPELLKGKLQGYWSRRIDREHRLVYKVSGTGVDQTLKIIQCRGHYDDR